MNKKVIWTVLIIIVALVAFLITKNNDSQESGKFKIGIILPMSGPAASLGKLSQNSVELALSDLSDKERDAIEIFYGDDQFDPKQTASVAQKLIDIDKVDALIAYSSPSSVAASYIAENAGIPMIGLGNSPDINTNKKWAVRFMLGPEPQSRAIVDLLLKDKYKKVAIIWNQSDGPKSVHDELVKILTNEGYEIVIDESVAKSETDFKTSISKIKAAQPEVVIAYVSPQVGIFAKQARDLGLNVPMVGGPNFEFSDQLVAAAGALNNQLFVGSDNVDFINKYYEKYNLYPTVAGDYVYDAVTVFSKQASETRDPGKIVDALRKDFSGASGQYVYKNDGSFDVKQVVKFWDGSKFVLK